MIARCATFLTAALLQIPIAEAAEYKVMTISDPNVVSRDPVISETRLIAWEAFTREAQDPGGIRYFVMIRTGQISRVLAQSVQEQGSANMRPCVHSNFVAWIMVTKPAEFEAWRLRQVPEPDRDIPVPELPAVYTVAFSESGSQVWHEVTRERIDQLLEVKAKAPSETVTEKPAEESVPTQEVGEAPPEAEQLPTNVAADVTEGVPSETPVEFEPVEKPTPELTMPLSRPRRFPSGDTEVFLWKDGVMFRVTADNRDDMGVSIWGDWVVWQTGKGWPFGWEIMAWSPQRRFVQLTTNFYYDVAPKVHEDRVVWAGWDGNDFEIFMWDAKRDVTIQITSNLYDDLSPEIWGNTIVWEGYPGANADVFMWQNGVVQKLSDNPEDDLNPKVWEGRVVWQAFDGEDFEIDYYDGQSVKRLTSNTYDDVYPCIRDGIVVWMGYEGNWDSEIFAWDGGADIIRLTENEVDDRNPRTAGGWIVWEEVSRTQFVIRLATPVR